VGNEKLLNFTPSPAGESWGEENKINVYIPHIPAPSTRLRAGFSLKGEGVGTCVESLIYNQMFPYSSRI
jgi:hypothetical protein